MARRTRWLFLDVGGATFISGWTQTNAWWIWIWLCRPPLTRLLDSLPSPVVSSPRTLPFLASCLTAAPTRSTHPLPSAPYLSRRRTPVLVPGRRGAEIHLCAARVDLVVRCWRRPWPPSSSTGGPPSACASPRRSTRWSPAAPSARSSPSRSLSSLTSL